MMEKAVAVRKRQSPDPNIIADRRDQLSLRLRLRDLETGGPTRCAWALGAAAACMDRLGATQKPALGLPQRGQGRVRPMTSLPNLVFPYRPPYCGALVPRNSCTARGGVADTTRNSKARR